MVLFRVLKGVFRYFLEYSVPASARALLQVLAILRDIFGGKRHTTEIFGLEPFGAPGCVGKLEGWSRYFQSCS